MAIEAVESVEDGAVWGVNMVTVVVGHNVEVVRNAIATHKAHYAAIPDQKFAVARKTAEPFAAK